MVDPLPPRPAKYNTLCVIVTYLQTNVMQFIILIDTVTDKKEEYIT